ncbi:AAA ATPase-like protein [Fragilaria crotonensis]|nr:AAA ATPase-like protein [Fragilaria crotonensis]
MANDAWLGLCEIPAELCEEYHLSPLDAIVIHDSSNAELTSTVAQVIPSKLSDIRLHPLLHEFLCRASTDEKSEGFQIHALPIEDPVEDLIQRSCWKFQKAKVICDLDESAVCDATIVYCDGDQPTSREIEMALEGRILKPNTTIAVSYAMGMCILVVNSVSISDPDAVYRVGPGTTVRLTRMDQASDPTEDMNDIQWEVDCPGYEGLLEELFSLCTTRGFAAPSGILLTGCSGVGKTRLASCLANKIMNANGGLVHWVSCQDLIMRASWASESEMLELLIPGKLVSLVVLDDLHLLSSDDIDVSNRDHEYTLLRNSVMGSLHQLTGTVVLGICRMVSNLPSQLFRIDRLEKEVRMEPPTQIQRHAILSSLIPNHPKWILALTGPTAGFVAADLHRMYADAWTSSQARSDTLQWHDLREAVHRATPSELALLDVSRPHLFSDGTVQSPLEMHRRSWEKFGGYADVKKRIFRTVVAPWHRHLKAEGPSIFGLNPPRGVLFHGPSGTGKTLAASCLAGSLGLNVVKVRASDVLDQWLGGSEAAIRTLFNRARGAQPCILYFDEIDAIASNREQEGAESDVSSRILTTLLNELDGISSTTNGGVLVLACTNRLGDLDAALLRPGRLEEHIELKLPSCEDLKFILQSHLANVPIAEGVNLEDFAEVFFELRATGADVEGVCRDACSLAMRTLEESDYVVLTFEALDTALRAWKR